MAVSFLQKMSLAFRGWLRRRDAAAKRRNEEFVQSQAGWETRPPATAVPVELPIPAAAPPTLAPDLEGLQVAFLDDSGRIDHYLDMESGEVIDIPSDERESRPDLTASPLKYRKVPTRNDASEADDRRAFITTMKSSPLRTSLATTLVRSDAAQEFRRILATDRAAERSWYNFKNDRAARAIANWLETLR